MNNNRNEIIFFPVIKNKSPRCDIFVTGKKRKIGKKNVNEERFITITDELSC